MKLLVAGGIAAVLLSSAAPAHADDGPCCSIVGVEHTEDVSTPLVAVAAGMSTDGLQESATIGWGWGTRERGVMFAGSLISRILLDLRHGERSSFALTYGWYETGGLGSAGFDLGAMAEASGAGPTMRLTLAERGLGVRLSTGIAIGHETHMVGSAELVVEVMELVRKI
jgi:hypothetical protein